MRNDGGVSLFAAGYKVKLVRQNVTADTTEDLVVLSVSPQPTGNSTITFTTTISGTFQGYIADAAEIIDVVFDSYTDAVTAQRTYAAIANNSTPSTIAATGHAAKTFLP